MTDVDPVVRRGDGWLVAFKPAGLPVDGDPDRVPDSFRLRLVRSLGLPFTACHPHTRLDLPVAGLTLWSLDPAIRRTLLGLTRDGSLRKLYLALSPRAPATDRVRLAAEQSPWRTRGGRPLPREPETRLLTLRRTGTATLLAVAITAGRQHQIRLHLATAGAPLVGDRLHGGPPRAVRPDGAVLAAPGVALEAVGLTWPGPGGGERILERPRGFLREAGLWSGCEDADWSPEALAAAWERLPAEPSADRGRG